MLVEIGPIKLRERVRVFREMGRHPIHDHADPGTMTRVDKMPQFIRRAEATCRRVVIRHLITPRTFERVLRHRHQFDMGVAHLEDIRQKSVG